MANNCLDTGLFLYDGTSQAQRSLDVLLAACPQVDERTTADLILFAKKYGAYLNYFDLTNTATGDWQNLLGSDSVVIIASIADWTTTDYANFVKTTIDNAIGAKNEKDAQQNFKVLFDFAFSLASGILNGYSKLPPASDYATFLNVAITSGIVTPLNTLLGYYNYFSANPASFALVDNTLTNNNNTPTFTYPVLPVDVLVFAQNFAVPPIIPPFNIQTTNSASNITFGAVTDIQTNINHVLTHNLFTGVYQTFIDAIVNIVAQTPAYLQKELADSPSHAPHYALYLTFLELFNYAQQHLNQYTKNHLDFYYKEVLQLSNNAAQPDLVNLVFTLQKNITQHLIPAGTSFSAGKDANSNNIFYATTGNVVLQTASVQLLRSLFLNKGISPATLFASPVANSADGRGAKLLSTDGSWFPFGDPQQNLNDATLGFAISSNVLYLNEGNRTVTITFNCSSLNNIAQTDLAGIFNLQFTGKSGWYTATDYTASLVSSSSFSLSVTLAGDAPAIIPYSSKLHSGNFTVALPMVQVILNSYTSYQTIKALNIETITVAVSVDAVKNLILQNNDGKIDTSKPFKVFGDFPDSGSSFIIGSKEVFQKELTSLTVNFEWQQKPSTDTTVLINTLAKGSWQSVNSAASVSLYASDITLTTPVTSVSKRIATMKGASFGLTLDPTLLERSGSLLTDYTETPEDIAAQDYMVTGPEYVMGTEYTLGSESAMGSAYFTDPAYLKNSGYTIDPGYAAADPSLSSVTTTGLNIIVQSPADFTASVAYDATSIDGYIELELNVTEYNLSSFLNSIPQPSVTVNYDTTDTTKVIGYTVNKTNTPVATPPALQAVYLSYSAEDNLLFTNTSAAFNTRTNYYYQIEPFGYREMHPFITTDAPLTVLPIFNLDDGSANDNGGELWIGLANALNNETFSVLFQVSDGSSNPLKAMTEVDWYYMSANNWVKFNSQSVTDGTSNLVNSGLIVFNVPGDATLNNTLADSNYLWIKGVVAHDTDAVCNLIAIDANAAQAQFVQVPASNIAFTNPIPPNTISKPAVADSALKQTQQPYNSYGGLPAETDSQFYIRVSERLRHKHRAITGWDYERLTLQYFPQIFKVKCLSHTGFITDDITGQLDYSETLAGQVTVITIPDLTKLSMANILRPYTSIGLLTNIQAYLQKLTSPFVTLNVCNPLFEEVQFDFSVTFKEGYDVTYYTNQLNLAIEQFLTPWANGNPQNIDFGTSLQKSVVLNFVEEQVYVDYVTCFKMNQFVRNGSVVEQAFYNIEEADPTTARSIMVSYYDAPTNTRHLISSPANCDC
ncbi:baseplate J-like protein [Mucilaginibacter frigoritolerans]|uniref:Baseplate J-like protein n=1 Tax=Mucilaginibacter frigoritolerans TaxID=652788 RepID=A0A562U9J9_9SPHI|nr:baseplate J/gp47 family protein [Mucilaginibacter frigoritolerans]TWJ02458.1 baseplate J-like protein [Mucilaginibacter frigoritolerans]